mmetsp:Transcript_792/g.995  ORF Transcript_792/g.995 Transcript_792/m.995 type:complete len:147 (-) Transcript_792:63-503(-)
MLKLVVTVLLFFTCASALNNSVTPESTCGGNCPSGGCPSCPCGSTSNKVDIASICSQYSGWSQGCCNCIANAESGGNANAVNYNSGGTYDVGLFQINDFNWDSCSGGLAPCNVQTNLGCAKTIFGWGGKTWKYWSTCSACGCCSKA